MEVHGTQLLQTCHLTVEYLGLVMIGLTPSFSFDISALQMEHDDSGGLHAWSSPLDHPFPRTPERLDPIGSFGSTSPYATCSPVMLPDTHNSSYASRYSRLAAHATNSNLKVNPESADFLLPPPQATLPQLNSEFFAPEHPFTTLDNLQTTITDSSLATGPDRRHALDALEAFLSGALDFDDIDFSQQPAVYFTRTQQACKRCRIRKVKCSGGSPCKRCSKTGGECSYLELRTRCPGKRKCKKCGPNADNQRSHPTPELLELLFEPPLEAHLPSEERSVPQEPAKIAHDYAHDRHGDILDSPEPSQSAASPNFGGQTSTCQSPRSPDLPVSPLEVADVNPSSSWSLLSSDTHGNHSAPTSRRARAATVAGVQLRHRRKSTSSSAHTTRASRRRPPPTSDLSTLCDEVSPILAAESSRSAVWFSLRVEEPAALGHSHGWPTPLPMDLVDFSSYLPDCDDDVVTSRSDNVHDDKSDLPDVLVELLAPDTGCGSSSSGSSTPTSLSPDLLQFILGMDPSDDGLSFDCPLAHLEAPVPQSSPVFGDAVYMQVIDASLDYLYLADTKTMDADMLDISELFCTEDSYSPYAALSLIPNNPEDSENARQLSRTWGVPARDDYVPHVDMIRDLNEMFLRS
ncbi:hypothetical protein C8Q80DRAFT_262157 [Daedaleopsis nitida]|nr:hypothetical protein C8Q80DRAFT_262157 [Daedaleopsis nitida]